MILLAALSCTPAYVPLPVCYPEVSTAGINATEGDPIAVEVICPAGPFTLTVANLPSGATFEGGHFAWTPGLDQAGDYEVTFIARHPEAREALSMQTAVSLSIADAWSAAGNVPVDPEEYTREWGLPVLHVDTGGSDSTGIGWDEIPVSIVWKGDGYDGTIHVRGASSASYPKQSFTLDIKSEDNLDLSKEGMARRDHLVLLSTFDDNSYVRQKLAYDVWADVSATRSGPQLAPRTFYLVLYVDGDYRGIYVGLDRIDDEFVSDMGFAEGGALYKAESHDANYRRTDLYGDPKGWLGQGWTQKVGEDLAPLESLVAFAADSDATTFVADPSYIDIQEFGDWYLWARTVDAGDSGGKNSYLYQDPADGRLRYCPWDLNYSFGQDWMTLRTAPEFANDFRWANQIFVHLQDDPASAAALSERFRELDAGPMSPAAMLARIDAYEAELGPARDRDWARWGDDYRSYVWDAYRGDDWTDPEEETAYLRGWLVAHVEALRALEK